MKRATTSIAAFFLMASVPASAEQDNKEKPEITEQEIADADGRIILQNVAIIPSPAANIWAAFTTEEGYKSWAAPVVFLDFRVGGSYETSYKPDAQKGDPANIKNEILAYIP